MLDRVARLPWTTLLLVLVALDLVCRVTPDLVGLTLVIDSLALVASLAVVWPRPTARLARVSAS